MLVISGASLVAFNLFAIAHYDLRHLAPVCLFSLANGFFIGMSIPSAIILYFKGKRKRGGQSGHAVVAAPGTTRG